MRAVKKSNRRIMREKTLQILYAYELNGEGLTTIIDGMLSDISDKYDKEFAERLINKVAANRSEIDDSIQSRLNNWKMERIALIDRLLLRMGMAEILYFDDIPPKVTMNEIIEIAKEYSTAKSGKFINGVLDSFLSELKETGKLNKTGRGLIEEKLPKPNDE